MVGLEISQIMPRDSDTHDQKYSPAFDKVAFEEVVDDEARSEGVQCGENV